MPETPRKLHESAASSGPADAVEFSEKERVNFGFLEAYDPVLAEFAMQAERFCLWDPCACLFKLRLYVERLAKLVGAGIFPHWNFREDLYRLLQRLEEYGAFGPEIARIFHRIRKVANVAIHHGVASREEALGNLRLAHGLGVWYARGQSPAAMDEDFPAFQEPRERPYGLALLGDRVEQLEEQVRAGSERSAELGRLQELAQAEAQMAQLRLREAGTLAGETGAWDLAALAGFTPETRPKPAPVVDLNLAEAFTLRCREAEARLVRQVLPLAQARWLVEAELREAGWEIGADEAGPRDGANLLLRNWPTYAGAADYVLFAGLTPVGVLAVRPDAAKLESALELATSWSRGYVFQPGEKPADGAPWGSFRVAWALAANGHDLANGGLLARNLKRANSAPKTLETWPAPPRNG